MFYHGKGLNLFNQKPTVMKSITHIILNAFLVLMLGSSALQAQQNAAYLGLPGDNLNLFAVMDIFRSSPTLEEFEQKLNDPESMINNLDLNNDNFVDYIAVYDIPGDDVHVIVLRVALNRVENQDVAAFFIQKMPNGSVVIQLVGDETLYGPDYIIEPNDGATPNPGYRGEVVHYNQGSTPTVVYREVSYWPIVVHIWDPFYRPWHSAWYWGYYPPYWRPWHPHYWHYYYGYHYHYHNHYHFYYRPWRHHRYHGYRTVYVSKVRTSSVIVENGVVFGRYKDTYKHPESQSGGEALYRQRISESKNPRQSLQKAPTRTNQPFEQRENVKQTNRPPQKGAVQETGKGRVEGNQNTRIPNNRVNQSTTSPAREQTRINTDGQGKVKEQARPSTSNKPKPGEVKKPTEPTKSMSVKEQKSTKPSNQKPASSAKPDNSKKNDSKMEQKSKGSDRSSSSGKSSAQSGKSSERNSELSRNRK